MASILRQIVAGPRARHPEAGLDLAYISDQIIATSGPSGTYPKRAYRNPLDQLVKFLDYKHGDDWNIWEFRAEGTGYPDSEVRGKVMHYPWPDHHPPPFKLLPMIMASMRNWVLHAGEQGDDEAKNGRVIVVHCKAGKGRSGTIACSYLISECGWQPGEALARFTERRMRPGFGQGVSIPSQLRWVGYVDRWTKFGKVYLERQIEITELHVWGLRDGVKVQIEGYVDEGKTIKVVHVFSKHEKVIVDGNPPGSGGIKEALLNMTGLNDEDTSSRARTDALLDGATASKPQKQASTLSTTTGYEAADAGVGGNAVVYKPLNPVVLPTSDVNVDFERRNKASMGWTMVTSVAHVWFNAYFEGNGPENNGKPNDNGVFEMDWDKMDGIRGSSKKGTRAFDRIAVVWKAYEPEPGRVSTGEMVVEPPLGSPVPQMAPAAWQGSKESPPGLGKDLGMRFEGPASANISKANSVKSHASDDDDDDDEDDDDSVKGVKPSGPKGEENISTTDLLQSHANASEPTPAAVNADSNTALSTTPQKTEDS